jgi:hypothetical protein
MNMQSTETPSDMMLLWRRLSQVNKHGRPITLPEYQRLNLAKVLSCAVLQLEGTPWLTGETLLSNNISVLDAATKTAPTGGLKLSLNRDKSLTPFIDVPLRLDCVESPSISQSSNITTALSQNQVSHRNLSATPTDFLYHLGILMLQLAYYTSFDRLMAEVCEDDATPFPLSTDKVHSRVSGCLPTGRHRGHLHGV